MKKGSQIVRGEAGFLCDASEHPWANLLLVVESENGIRPTRPRQNSMRTAGFALDTPADAKGGPPGRTALSRSPNGSCCHGENLVDFWGGLTLFDSFSEHAQAECFYAGNRFIARRPVGQGARNLSNLGDPAAIRFLLGLYGKRHEQDIGSDGGERQDDRRNGGSQTLAFPSTTWEPGRCGSACHHTHRETFRGW